MKMEDSLHEKVPKTASRATLLMGIVFSNVQMMILVLKKFGILSRPFLAFMANLEDGTHLWFQ